MRTSGARRPSSDRISGLALALASLALWGAGCGGWVLPTDPDGDGWSAEAGDCDNSDPAVYPGAVEVCDGKDNDCDHIFEIGGVSELDGDGDGWIACFPCAAGQLCGDCDDARADVHPQAEELCDGLDNDCDGQGDVDADHDGACLPADCDDHDPGVHPGAPELCNGQDDDCDQAVEDPGQDADGDGWPVCDAAGDDCNDADPSVHPYAVEHCNGRDDDCDGQVDDPPGAFDFDDDGTSDCVDNDLDGFTESHGDCDDLSRTTWPGAEEFLDEADNDCDGRIDEDLSQADRDGDGFTAATGDCDDADARIHPGADETCDGDDEDCDRSIDEGLLTSWWKDGDLDGYGHGGARQSCTRPSGGWATASGDCDDTQAAIHPGAPELCNAVDDDCDQEVDEWPDEAATWYRDDDEDGWGDADHPVESGCQPPAGYTGPSGDCDDHHAQSHPGHEEWCSDGIDNDCDGQTDEATGPAPAPNNRERTTLKEEDAMQLRLAVAAAMIAGAPVLLGSDGCCEPVTFYFDGDGDGFGDPNNALDACEAPAGYVENSEDCNDRDPYTNPLAREVCDGRDNNCDGTVDEDCTDGQALCERTGGEWTLGCGPATCLDPDGDEGISCLVAIELCRCPEEAPFWDEDKGCITVEECDVPVDQDGDGYPYGRDCDDEDATVFPGARERCDGKDNDCDGAIDEDCPNDQRLCEATGGEWQECGDGCGLVFCPGEQVPAFPCAADADACVPQCHCPADAPYWLEGEGCVSERECPDTTDRDGDGYSVERGDCDDTNPRVNPGATEVCDYIDNDCDGRIDESGGRTYYQDNDLDGYGGDNTAVSVCGDPPPIYVTVGGDCNDRDPAINPAAAELCDGVDNDCDRAIDEQCDCFFAEDGTYYCPCDTGLPTARTAPQVPIQLCECDPETGECPSDAGLCRSTNGRWNECGSGCGPETCANPSPGDICPDVCVPQCECPADAPFWDDELGCIARDSCDNSSQRLCEATGGEWGDGCVPATCADPNAPLLTLCVTTSPMCFCPARAPYWDPARGCISPDECRAGPPVNCSSTGGSWIQDCSAAASCSSSGTADFDCADNYWTCACTREAPYWEEDAGCLTASQCADHTGGRR